MGQRPWCCSMKEKITAPPWRRRPSLDGRELTVSGEGLVAFLVEGLLPGAEQRLADVQGAGGLGHGVALLGDQLDGLDLELAGVAASLSRRCGPPAVIIHRYLGVHHSWGGS